MLDDDDMHSEHGSDETMGSPGMRSRGLPVLAVGSPPPARAYH